jgi:hypothetical protein
MLLKHLIQLLKHLIHLIHTWVAHATKAPYKAPDSFGASGSEKTAHSSAYAPNGLLVVGEREIMHRQNLGVGHASEQQEARLKGREQLQARALPNRQQQVSQQDRIRRMKRAAEEEFLSAVQAEPGLVTTRSLRSPVQGPSIHPRQQQHKHEITGEHGSVQRHEFIKDLAVFQMRLEPYYLPKGVSRPGTTRQSVLP